MSVAGLRFSPDHGARARDPAETRSGSYIYGGDPAGFHDWEFRTMLRLRMYEEFLRTKKTAKRTVKEGEEESEEGSAEAEAKEAFRDTRSELTHRIVEGLRGDAFLVARDLGLDALSEPQGTENLIKQVRDMVFPRATEEARELFRVGQKPQGALSRQRGESMISYISPLWRWIQRCRCLSRCAQN